MKFIHIADVHLGAKPDKDKPWGKEREGHSWLAFTEVITKAKEEQAQLLLIAGDLFHRQPLIRELKDVSYQFSRIPQTQVVIIAGNRDYLGENSCYRTFSWGENVHFIKEQRIHCIDLEGIGVRVYGLSYGRREIQEDLCSGISVKEDGCYNILLAHGGDEKHMPFEEGTLGKAPYDYVALGHIHKPMKMIGDRVVMAGALQPVSSEDTGEHGYFMGELEKDGVKVDFYPLHYCEYVSLNMKVNKDITTDALKDVLVEQIKKAPVYQLFKVNLTGSRDSSAPIELEALARLEQVAQVTDRCHPEYDFEKLKLKYQQQILGRYIEALEKMPQDEIVKKALYYGVEALLAE